ncbi:SgcJ/EcaC family oxidoreductase [uncultured Sphingomonas sp.]|uniref:YybH family protein n=1 Tax=uncultured Sphingomonas sp. TaxID=158754 RepID=UPI0025EB4C5A|nr:SgcJ/EcaC family oxidoreductase [uncultured Sphingomonas sp.]
MNADADIATWLDEHEAAWNANDVPAMFARSSPDLQWVNVVGMHWQGRDAVIQAHQIFFNIMFNDVPISLLGLDSIVRLGDGTRIAVARWRLGDYATPQGHRVTDEANRMTLVFSGKNETLQLRHVANLRIDANAAPHDPIHAG